MQTNRSRFERSLGHGVHVTTIAPNVYPGYTSLADMGWRFVTRNPDGEEVSSSCPDAARREILRGFGHKV